MTRSLLAAAFRRIPVQLRHDAVNCAHSQPNRWMQLRSLSAHNQHEDLDASQLNDNREELRSSHEKNANVQSEMSQSTAKSQPSRMKSGALNSGPDPSASQIVETLSMNDNESFPRLQRLFVDRFWLEVKAGNGGNPAPGATRLPNLTGRIHGPGYGGDGASVILRATHLIESFLDIPQKIKGAHGGDGLGDSRGLHAKNMIVQVPVGTIVRERVYSGERTEEGRKMYLPRFKYQFLRTGDTYHAAKGGRGGIGPQSFKKHDGRPGAPGQRARIELELRLLNDCAFIGKPNAGKTALLAALSRAHTRIGPEEYSTVRPHIGVIKFRDAMEIRLCDLPGIHAGASEDKDLGRRVLRHTYRSRVLAFVVDVARGEKPDANVLDEVEMLRQEACMFDPLNADKPWMVIGTKCDSLHKDALFHLDSLHFRLRARYGSEIPVVGTSARFGLGLSRMVRKLRQLLYPDMLEPIRRAPAQPWNLRIPGVLHGPLDDALESIERPALPLLQPSQAVKQVSDGSQ